jgi:hypothetical protein
VAHSGGNSTAGGSAEATATQPTPAKEATAATPTTERALASALATNSQAPPAAPTPGPSVPTLSEAQLLAFMAKYGLVMQQPVATQPSAAMQSPAPTPQVKLEKTDDVVAGSSTKAGNWTFTKAEGGLRLPLLKRSKVGYYHQCENTVTGIKITVGETVRPSEPVVGADRPAGEVVYTVAIAVNKAGQGYMIVATADGGYDQIADVGELLYSTMPLDAALPMETLERLASVVKAHYSNQSANVLATSATVLKASSTPSKASKRGALVQATPTTGPASSLHPVDATADAGLQEVAAAVQRIEDSVKALQDRVGMAPGSITSLLNSVAKKTSEVKTKANKSADSDKANAKANAKAVEEAVKQVADQLLDRTAQLEEVLLQQLSALNERQEMMEAELAQLKKLMAVEAPRTIANMQPKKKKIIRVEDMEDDEQDEEAAVTRQRKSRNPGVGRALTPQTPAKDMVYCIGCSVFLPSTAKYCRSCGSSQE